MAKDNDNSKNRVEVCRSWETKPLMENDELAMIFDFKSDRLLVSASKIPPGGRSKRDPGHAGSDEVAYCIRGEVVIEVGEGEGDFVQLAAGDAALIHEGVPHTAFNPTDGLTEVLWCVAPQLGRPLVYE